MSPTQNMAFLPGFELTVERGGEMVDPGPLAVEPRPTWHFVDSQGHGHFYGGDSGDRYPTLTWVSEPCTMGHGDDCEAEGHYECKLCGEEVQPGMQSAKPFWVDGPDSYRLTIVAEDQQITYAFGEEQWETLQAALVEAVLTALSGCVVEVRTSA